MIEGVVIKPLKRICDDRGTIMKMQEATDDEYAGFGEIYFSTVYPGVVKGWHMHLNTILNYAVVSGMIKLVLYDDRENSPTRGELMEIIMGEENYCLVQIPSNVWNGFKGVGTKTAIVADLTNNPHAVDEMVRLDPQNNDIIKYDWSLKFR
jgi:dTDP-4-dehydrorhamnose 3,5-epimerase